jgi:predicted ATP-grasp superfamily ATP-dependent carboligase
VDPDLRGGRVIVTYGRSLMALTIAHSLGRRGVEVIGADDVGLTAVSFSRHVSATFVHASPALEPDRFIADLEAEIRRRRPSDGRPYVLIPCFEETRIIARHAERLAPLITVAAPPIAAIEAVDPKDALMRTAGRLALPTPATWTAEALRIGSERPHSYPLVAKPMRGVGGRGVRRLADPGELEALLAQSPQRLLIQAFAPGEDYCLTALYDRGRRLASAAYRNLSQFPRGAGAGVLRETVPDAPFLATADALFGALGWTGVVEADFRWDGGGDPLLIEVNPRFWAGLFHTVESGVDFPWLLYELAVTGRISQPPEPRLGQRTKVGALYLLSAIQEIAESEEGFARAKLAWSQAAHLFQSGRLLEASRELGGAVRAGFGIPWAAQRLKQALRSAKNAPNELFRSDDPLVSLGALFVVASLMRHGRLPPELTYDPRADGLVVD